MRGVFIVGTDTGVGKTVVAAALLGAAPEGTRYWKPVQTGSDLDDDTATVAVLGDAGTGAVFEAGARLRIPASPHWAAAREGVRVRSAELATLLEIAPVDDHPWIVEGAGGLLVPLNEEELLPDLIARLALPVLLVSSTRLGTINHTLLTVRILGALSLPCLGIVLVGHPDASAETALAAHCPLPVLGQLPHLEPLTAAALRPHGEALLRSPNLAQVFGAPR